MPEEHATDRCASAPSAGSFVPELEFESVAPTLQQADETADGLRILATWLLRRHERLQKEEGGTA